MSKKIALSLLCASCFIACNERAIDNESNVSLGDGDDIGDGDGDGDDIGDRDGDGDDIGDGDGDGDSKILSWDVEIDLSAASVCSTYGASISICTGTDPKWPTSDCENEVTDSDSEICNKAALQHYECLSGVDCADMGSYAPCAVSDILTTSVCREDTVPDPCKEYALSFSLCASDVFETHRALSRCVSLLEDLKEPDNCSNAIFDYAQCARDGCGTECEREINNLVDECFLDDISQPSCRAFAVSKSMCLNEPIHAMQRCSTAFKESMEYGGDCPEIVSEAINCAIAEQCMNVTSCKGLDSVLEECTGTVQVSVG